MRHRSLLSLAALVLLVVLAAPAASAGSGPVVDDDGADCPDAGHTAIQSAVDAAGPGDTVEVCAGTYGDGVTVDTQDLTLTGPEDATVTARVTVAADGVTLQGLEFVDHPHWIITVEGSVADLTLDDVRVADNRQGFRTHGPDAVDGLTVTDSTFVGNGIGLYFQNDPNFVDDPSNLGHVSDVVVEDTEFIDQERKGIYAETLKGATIEDVVIDGITSATHGYNDGIDLNLKAGDYSDIVVRDTLVANVAEGDPGAPWGDDPLFSAAIAVKARDDPSRYDSNPATLEGITFENVVVRDSFNGLRIGEPGVDYSTYDAPKDVSVHGSSFTGIEEVALVNLGTPTTDATHNWWNARTGPSSSSNPLPAAAPTGETVKGNVDVTPWCVVPDCTANQALHDANPHPAP